MWRFLMVYLNLLRTLLLYPNGSTKPPADPGYLSLFIKCNDTLKSNFTITIPAFCVVGLCQPGNAANKNWCITKELNQIDRNDRFSQKRPMWGLSNFCHVKDLYIEGRSIVTNDALELFCVIGVRSNVLPQAPQKQKSVGKSINRLSLTGNIMGNQDQSQKARLTDNPPQQFSNARGVVSEPSASSGSLQFDNNQKLTVENSNSSVSDAKSESSLDSGLIRGPSVNPCPEPDIETVIMMEGDCPIKTLPKNVSPSDDASDTTTEQETTPVNREKRKDREYEVTTVELKAPKHKDSLSLTGSLMIT